MDDKKGAGRVARPTLRVVSTASARNARDAPAKASKSTRDRPDRAGPNSIDLHLGAEMRNRRVALNLSLQKLGKLLGVSAKMLEQYELGETRIGAERLQEIAVHLQVSPSYFFRNFVLEKKSHNSQDVADDLNRIENQILRAEARMLLKYFNDIKDPAARAKVVALAADLSAPEGMIE